MNSDNTNKFMSSLSEHVANFNQSLKNTKSNLIVDFIRIDHQDLIITSNRVTSLSEITIVNNYVRNCNNINSKDIQDTCLSQSKSYLKILNISYIIEGFNVFINSNIIESVIKTTHIFDNVNIASKPHIVKVLSKSDMAIIWIDIWDSQSSSTAKKLINHCFNIGSFVTTIRETNINPSIPQCKNCQKWGHITFACCLQGARCLKCNNSHKTEYHHHFTWYCKANFKTNPPYLETKQDKPCPHSFNCINYKSSHQANSNAYQFQHYQFNKEWHAKKYQELRDFRAKSICSTVSSNNQ